jgi:hypothetical protein
MNVDADYWQEDHKKMQEGITYCTHKAELAEARELIVWWRNYSKQQQKSGSAWLAERMQMVDRTDSYIRKYEQEGE